jgi:molybdate/tungstate transport system substrate-binding protein
VTLPREIDLGDPSLAAHYATASVRVAGRTPGDSATFTAGPILYGLAIPRTAPHPAAARRFVQFLLTDGERAMQAAYVDVLDAPRVVGTGAPAWLTAPPPRQ